MFQQRFDYLRLPRFVADNILMSPENIKIGVGQNAIRRIYKVMDYDQYERMQISLLAQHLQKLNKYESNLHTDDLLLRYLYANKFEISKSAEQLLRTSDIIFQPGYMQLDKEVESLYYKGAIYIEGRTRTHLPCIVISTKLIDDLNLFERAAIILCAIIEDYMFYPGKIESWIAVIQTKDQSAFKMQQDKIFQIIQILQTCFPNTCEAIYILNATLSINLMWSQIEEAISPLTLNKIKFIKERELPILSNQFNPENLEQALGGEKILQCYWPPDPNDYMYEQPIQQQPVYEEQSQIFFSQPNNNNLQYTNEAPILFEEVLPPPPPPPIKPEPVEQPSTLSEKKRRCICVKCSRDLEEVASQPRPPKTPPLMQQSQPIEKPTILIEPIKQQQTLQQLQSPIQQSQSPMQQQQTNQQQLDDTYIPYERKYDSFINESGLLAPPPVEKQEFGGNSFNNTKQPDQQSVQSGQQRSNKPSFNNPYFENKMQESQKIEPKQQPVISNMVSQEIQANMDDTIIEKPDYQPKYVNKHSRPQNSTYNYQPSVNSRVTSNANNNFNFQNIPSYNPNNQSLYPQVQTLSSQQNINPPYSQSQIPVSQQYVPIEPIQQQPVLVQDFENPINTNFNQSYFASPQLSSDPKKKYDFSQWDKYNDLNDPYPIQTKDPYTLSDPYQINTNTLQQYNYTPTDDYNKLYDNTSDYKPGEFRPSTYNFTPYDYRYSDQQYQPRIEGTTKSNGPQQLYQQKPGQQACQIF